MKVGVIKETAPGERRVALVPEMIARLRGAGLDVLVQSGAGDGAWFADSAYAEAGAAIVPRDELLAEAGIVGRSPASPASRHRRRAAVRARRCIGHAQPAGGPRASPPDLAARGVTAISLDGLPRTLPKSPGDGRAHVPGERRRLQGGAGRRPAAFGRFFPLLITAAGTARPAKVLVLGTGVAGLQAIGTAQRLGAVVSAYDVRPQTKTEVESLGANFIELTSVGTGGRRGRLRPRADRGGAAGAAGRADRPHRPARRGHHDRPGAGPPPAAAGHRGRGQGDGGRARWSWTWGRARSAGNVAGSVPGADGRDRERRDRDRRGQPGRHACRPARRPPTRATSAPCCCTWSPTASWPSTCPTRSRPGSSSPTTGPWSSAATAALLAETPRRYHAVSTALLTDITIFVLALLVGFEVISKVPATLHTPLMSAANSIHGIVLAGAMLIAVDREQRARLHPRVRRRRVRRHERGRRLRRHRADAQDVPAAAAPRCAAGTRGPRWTGAGPAARHERFDWITQLLYVAAAVCFVLGLHLMNSPALGPARQPGVHRPAWSLADRHHASRWSCTWARSAPPAGSSMLAGALVGARAPGCTSARTVQMTAMPQLVSLFNAVGGGAAALVAINDYVKLAGATAGLPESHHGHHHPRRAHRRGHLLRVDHRGRQAAGR